MKLHAGRLGLAAGLSIIIMNVVSWIFTYIYLSIQVKQLVPLTFEIAALTAIFFSLCISFVYAFALVWLSATLYNQLGE